MLSSILDEFIYEGILSGVVIMENNSFEPEGHKVNLVKNNDKNNLYHAIESAGINKLRILSGCIYIDINKSI